MSAQIPSKQNFSRLLTTHDRQILEQIGYLAIHRASKRIITDRKTQFLNQMKKDDTRTIKN